MADKIERLKEFAPSLTMNLSLLAANASQVKEIGEVCSPGRNANWLAVLVIIIISMTLQVLIGILEIRRQKTSKFEEGHQQKNNTQNETQFSDINPKPQVQGVQQVAQVANQKRKNLTVWIEILTFITVVLNVVVCAIGIPDDTCSKAKGDTPSSSQVSGGSPSKS